MSLSTAHSTSLLYTRLSAMSSNKSLQHNLHPNMPYRLSTAHSFCIQHRPYWLLCSVAMKPQHNPFSVHDNMHYTPSTTHSTAFPVQDNSSRYSSQNGTRYRDSIKVLWLSFLNFWLVFECSISSCACFY